MRARKMFDLHEGYESAMARYGELVEEFGCTRLEWGFGRWLWLDVKKWESKLEFWGRLDDLGILTAFGKKRLAAARRAKEREDREAEDRVGRRDDETTRRRDDEGRGENDEATKREEG